MFSWRRMPILKAPKVFGGTILLGGSVFKSDHDVTDDEILSKYRGRSSLTPWERIQLMWRQDEYGQMSPELNDCQQIIFHSTSFAFFIGGLLDSQKVYQHVMTHHRNEMFRHPREAQIAVFNALTLKYFQSGFKLAIKAFILSSVYALSSRTIDVARNSRNPFQHSAAGFVAGASLRIVSGPKAMMGSGMLGACFGLVDGVFVWSGRRFSEESMEDEYLRKLKVIKEKSDKMHERNHAILEEEIPREIWKQDQVIVEEDTSPIAKPLIKVILFIKELFSL